MPDSTILAPCALIRDIALSAPWLAVRLTRRCRAVSWSENRPGFVETDCVLWRQVRNADLPPALDVTDWIARELAGAYPDDAVVLLTSRAIDRYRVATATVSDVTATCIATVGLTLSLIHISIARGDANYLSVLDEADAYAARNGLDLPDEPEARLIDPDPPCLSDPIRSLDLAAEGIAAIVWATGFAYDFGWLQVDAFDAAGRPRHERGVASEPGVYFVGLPWLSRRGSSFIWGVWHDARHIADQIMIQRAYRAHFDAAAHGLTDKS